MRGGHDASTEVAPALRRFALGLRRRRALGAGFTASARAGLVLAVALASVGWLTPSLLPSAAYACAAAFVVVGAAAAARAWWGGRGGLPSLPEGAPSSVADGQVFHDELVTWLEFDQRAARERGHRGTAERGGMIRWLERDVHVRLQPHRRSAARAAGALRLGRWRWLFPLVVALLLAWLLSAWLQPPWSGLVGGRPQAAAGAAAVDVEARTAAAGGDSEPAEPSSEEGARGEDEPALAAPTPSDGGDPTEPDDPEETPPLVDAPDDQRFVLPDFIGDGPTRRERMHVAELEQPRPGGAPRRQERSAAGGAGESRPRAAAVDFERAAERAVRSRHVPDAERGIVRRFFDELKKRGKR